MSTSEQTIAIKILDRVYQIKCQSDNAAQLQESAVYLDEQMKKARQQSASANNTERLAVITALNMCHELMMMKRQKNMSIDMMNDQIKTLQKRIQKFLGVKEEMAV